MLFIPAINVVLLITLNSAIPLIPNGSIPQSVNATHELPSMSWLPNDGYCTKNATCVSRNATCFGVPLPYSETSPDVVAQLFNNTDLIRFKDLQRNLERWESLRKVPKCWQALQPFLCALYLPKCEHGTVYLLSQERCRFTMATCKILSEPYFLETFPSINCDAIEHFPPTCKNDVKDLRSNLSGECISPFIPTDSSESYYDVVNGCGVQCQDPLITKDEHEQIHKMIAWGASISASCNLFVMASFLIEWRSGNKYPASIIFYINICFFVMNLGWLAQFLPNAREDIVCKKDLTLRKSEPSAGENLSCVVVFVVVYYFLMAACVWLVILTYAWHLSFQALGRIQARIDKKGAYFHMVAWSFPLVLTITTMASRQIDGNSIAGICFVRSSGWGARVGLVLVPLGTTVIVGGYFLLRGLPYLISVKRDSHKILSVRASSKIREIIVKIGIFSLFCLLFVMVTFICHIYEFMHEEEWQMSLRKYLYCQILSSKSDPRECKMDSRPSVAMIQVQLLVMFAAGITMSFWVLTPSTIDTWRRFVNRRIFRKDVQEPIILKKHKIIAQAFAKRKKLTDAGKLELSIRNSHTDPVGLKFEINSTASHLSSDWLAAFHKLVDRRGALVEATTESNSSKRRNSYDSESYTYSVRRVSVESRRHSLDSQISLQISEVTATHKTNTPRPSHHDGRRGKRRRKDFARSRRHHKNLTRRGSSTSQESQIGMKIFALAMNNSNILPQLLKRRPGNAGLEATEAVANKLPVSVADLSDDEPSQGDVLPDVGISDDYSNNSDEELCGPGQGIQTLEWESDNSNCRYTDEEEAERIEKILRLERAVTARGSQKNKIQIKDLEYRQRNKYKCDEYSKKSKRRNSRKGEATSVIARRSRVLEEDLGNLVGRSRHQIGGSDLKYRIRKSRCNRSNVGVECKMLDDSKLSDSETEDDEDSQHLQQSVGVQIRAGSSRSKRSVDVGTQISTQEMATQTDPQDYSSQNVPTMTTSNQGTQMTPPFHIRLINKTLSGNGGSSLLRENNYSYTSLMNQASEAQVK